MFKQGFLYFLKTQICIIFIFNILSIIVFILLGLSQFLPPEVTNGDLGPTIILFCVFFICGILYSKRKKPINLIARYFSIVFPILYSSVVFLIFLAYFGPVEIGNYNAVSFFMPYNLYQAFLRFAMFHNYNNLIKLYMMQIVSLIFLLVGYFIGDKFINKEKTIINASKIKEKFNNSKKVFNISLFIISIIITVLGMFFIFNSVTFGNSILRLNMIINHTHNVLPPITYVHNPFIQSIKIVGIVLSLIGGAGITVSLVGIYKKLFAKTQKA